MNDATVLGASCEKNVKRISPRSVFMTATSSPVTSTSDACSAMSLSCLRNGVSVHGATTAAPAHLRRRHGLRSLHHPDEPVGELRVELSAGVEVDVMQRLDTAERRPVRPLGRHGFVRVTQREDARLDRDVLPRETLGVAFAVPSLVMRARPRQDLREVRRREDALAEHGVFVHLLALFLGQQTRLLQHLVRDTYHTADVEHIIYI